MRAASLETARRREREDARGPEQMQGSGRYERDPQGSLGTAGGPCEAGPGCWLALPIRTTPDRIQRFKQQNAQTVRWVPESLPTTAI